jgi:hypothetical protein
LRKLAPIAIALLSLLLAGCAKFPSQSVQPSGKQLVIRMSVAGRINPSYFYYVAFNTGSQTSLGPLPVIAPPWGNGWGTGTITHFVRYAQGGYRIFRILPNTNNLGIVDTGSPPISSEQPSGGGTLRFTVDLSQIASEIPADQIQTLTVNFIATDIVPTDPYFPGPKYYDALGETGSDFLTISTEQSRVYSNSDFQIEPAGDVLNGDSDLDIVDWSVEVQRF